MAIGLNSNFQRQYPYIALTALQTEGTPWRSPGGHFLIVISGISGHTLQLQIRDEAGNWVAHTSWTADIAAPVFLPQADGTYGDCRIEVTVGAAAPTVYVYLIPGR